MVVINFNKMDEMQTITRETILEACSRSGRRICFSVYRHQLPEKSSGKFYALIKLPFKDGIISHIFPNLLSPDQFGRGYFWSGIETEEEFNEITNWCNERSNYVYIRDCLSASAALSINFNQSNERTEICKSVYKCKFKPDEQAILQLTESALEFINKHAIYGGCNCVVAVPPDSSKGYDLPSSLAGGISQRLGAPDITPNFKFGAKKHSAREIDGDDPNWFDKKWDIWHSANLTYQGKKLNGAKILLIDDNYQSGISLQYVAMILQQSGADQVYGLTMIKTRGDRGN